MVLAKIESRKIGELKPNEWNPNELPQDKLKQLKKEMVRVGYLQPILVNKDNVVIDGHHRLKAFKELKGDDYSIPVVVVDMSDKEAKLQMVNMNLIKGIMNPKKLGDLLINLEENFDKERLSGLVGMSIEEINILERIKENQMEEAQMMIHAPVGKETHQKILENEENLGIIEEPVIQGITTHGLKLPVIFFVEDEDTVKKISDIFNTDEFGWKKKTELNTNKLIDILKKMKLWD